jgi:hypothetical protein
MAAAAAVTASAWTPGAGAPRSLETLPGQAWEAGRMIVEVPGVDIGALRHAHPGHQGLLSRARPRPAGYWWQQGSAVGAGVATGYVNGYTAVAWAGPAPVPNYCWYFVAKGSLDGFWDVCP